ncbi:MAG: alpha-amylase family glycosyl hydrolase [Flavobacteriaceae bacterium]
MKFIPVFLMAPLFFLILSCESPKPQPQKPIEKPAPKEVLNPIAPLNEEAIAQGVLYQTNIRQYSNEGTFNAFAADLPKLKKMGVKLLWLMPINPISTTRSKGPLGSYYAVSDYTKVNPEFGTLDDFKALVKKAHHLGIYVLIDWVPGHTGWDHHWIKEHDDFYVKNRRGEIIDPVNYQTGQSYGWTDVADLNYNNMEMREAMRQAMLYWVKECNIDGFRIDQAYAVPVPFYEKTFAALNAIKPVFILAETDIYHPGGLPLVEKFDATYDWPGHHLSKEIAQGKKPLWEWDRHFRNLLRRYGTKNIVVHFVTNHDENSWNGTVKESYGEAGAAFMALNFTVPGMPLIYSGQEYDLDKRLLFFEKDSFPKVAGETMKLLQQLGQLKNNHPALAAGENAGSFTRLKSSRDNQVFAFQREKAGDTVMVIANLSKNYAQFTMPVNGSYKRFDNQKKKVLSESYQYDMKPWEVWILTNL